MVNTRLCWFNHLKSRRNLIPYSALLKKKRFIFSSLSIFSPFLSCQSIFWLSLLQKHLHEVICPAVLLPGHIISHLGCINHTMSEGSGQGMGKPGPWCPIVTTKVWHTLVIGWWSNVLSVSSPSQNNKKHPARWSLNTEDNNCTQDGWCSQLKRIVWPGHLNQLVTLYGAGNRSVHLGNFCSSLSKHLWPQRFRSEKWKTK